MAIKTFGKTISGSGLAVDGERLLLQHPQTMAECMGHVVPYQMPHSEGGFLILAEYGAPDCDPGCGDPAPAAKTTCGGCGCTSKASCTCEKKPDPMAGSLLRFEIVGYSGFDTDGVTALITERGAEGTIKQDWPAGTLVVQAPTGSELGALDDRLKAIEDLGCILAVQAAKACEVIKAGQWRCYDGCWRQAKVDAMLTESDDGSLDMPAAGEAGNASWSDCWGMDDLLNLLNDPKGIKSIDDSDPSVTLVTLNDGTVFSSPEQADTDTDTRLSNPTLSAAGTSYVWDVIDLSGAVIGTVIQPIPSGVRNCAGTVLPFNSQVVACDEFAGLFEAMFSNQDLCIPVADLGQSCQTLSQLVAVEKSPGCFALGRVPTGSQCYGVIFNDVHTDIFPADTDGDSTELYSVDALQADYAAGTVDLALLASSLTAQGEVTVPCDASYTFATTNAVVLTDAYLGTGQFVMTVNDVLLTNSAGQVVFSDVFTNKGGNFTQESWVGYLTAGTHTLKRHYLATSDGSGDVAQIRRSTGTVQVCKKDL